MQSINQGFHQLRLLMPHLQGEKLSKVCAWHCLNLLAFSVNYYQNLCNCLSISCCGVNIWWSVAFVVLIIAIS